MFGWLFHLGLDALIISAFLAGIRRSTGLTPALSQVPNKDIRQLLRSYLEVGEYAFDFAVVIFGVCNWHSVSSYLKAHAADNCNSAPVLLRGGIEFESITFAAPQFPSPVNSALLIIPHSLPCNILFRRTQSLLTALSFKSGLQAKLCVCATSST
ncbi:DUF1748-domain-containing protein [Suillus brevipes Sb2]|nr:DUF1748-domain-containing protein [Suillus brevipes Sb2]